MASAQDRSSSTNGRGPPGAAARLAGAARPRPPGNRPGASGAPPRTASRSDRGPPRPPPASSARSRRITFSRAPSSGRGSARRAAPPGPGSRRPCTRRTSRCRGSRRGASAGLLRPPRATQAMENPGVGGEAPAPPARGAGALGHELRLGFVGADDRRGQHPEQEHLVGGREGLRQGVDLVPEGLGSPRGPGASRRPVQDQPPAPWPPRVTP